MKVLAVRQPWVSLIIHGGKTAEIRTMKTKICERIAIYASRTSEMKLDNDWLEEYGIDDEFFDPLFEYSKFENTDPFPKGYILGTVSLFECNEIKSKDWFESNIDSHMNNPDWYQPGRYSWELADPCAITPIQFKFKPGQVVWSSIEGLK